MSLLVVLVLLHKGKGGGLSDMFGGGISSSFGGSSAAERNLDRITIGLGLVWVALHRRSRPAAQGLTLAARTPSAFETERQHLWPVAVRSAAAESAPDRWARPSAATPRLGTG